MCHWGPMYGPESDCGPLPNWDHMMMHFPQEGDHLVLAGVVSLTHPAVAFHPPQQTEAVNFSTYLWHDVSASSLQASSLPPLSLEAASTSNPVETPKILRPSITISSGGLKELQEVSNPIRLRNLRASPGNASSAVDSVSGPSDSTSSSSSAGRFGWKLPGINALTRTWSNAK
ncbi:hypothetical protein KSP40_PGU018743 [Platanthera guangdongensis]|uniref:Uncharacterized protein n=1 Tax=Platanthera guangdongensis TaxID=2320717 RepID=A0ABR2M4U9_9ASPA